MEYPFFGLCFLSCLACSIQTYYLFFHSLHCFSNTFRLSISKCCFKNMLQIYMHKKKHIFLCNHGFSFLFIFSLSLCFMVNKCHLKDVRAIMWIALCLKLWIRVNKTAIIFSIFRLCLKITFQKKLVSSEKDKCALVCGLNILTCANNISKLNN